MGYGLGKAESFGAGLQRIYFEELDAALRELGRIGRFESDAIHEYRRHLKKTRSLFHFARYVLPDKKMTRAAKDCLRQATRLFAFQRDNEALGECLERIISFTETSDTCLLFERVRSQTALIANHKDAQRTDLNESLEKARHLLEEARRAGNDWSECDMGSLQLCRGIGRSYREAFVLMKQACEKRDAESLHQWRKHVKHLRHHVMIISTVWPALFTMLETELHALSDLLGDIHDCALLVQFIEQRDFEFLEIQEMEEALKIVQARVAQSTTQSLRMGALLFVERPSAFRKRIRGYMKLRNE